MDTQNKKQESEAFQELKKQWENLSPIEVEEHKHDIPGGEQEADWILDDD